MCCVTTVSSFLSIKFFLSHLLQIEVQKRRLLFFTYIRNLNSKCCARVVVGSFRITHQFLPMAKVLAITAISVSIFLIATVIVLDVYEIDHVKDSEHLSPWLSCKCVDESRQENFGEMSHNLFHTLKETSVTTNEAITNIAFYRKLMRKRVGARDGKKTDISLISAFEYPQQINVMITSIAKYGDKIYCRYFDMSMQEIGNPFESVVFPEYTVMCLRREGARFMSLSDTLSGEYEYPVPITVRTQSEPAHFFSICLAPIYGTEPKWLHLAELVEHYKIQVPAFYLGATHFYMYSKYIDEYSRILLDDYVRTGDAEIVILHDRFERKDDRWQSMEIQECLNRAQGHSRWVAFVDLDERLTPTNYSGTLRSYLENMADDKIGAVQFRQRWILKNETLPERYTDSTQIASWMPTRRYHNTSHVGPVGHTAKCIIDPKKVLIMHVHYVNAFYEGYTMYRMRPEEGVVRHYRDVNSGQWGKIWLKEVEGMGNFSTTDYPAKWANELLTRVQRRVHYVYGAEIRK
ncbi:unnamed protein product [Cylicocyclus nassatus]|uniref:Glycosyltransferase family 92 protein n=1 Tax=Cylicocyclus nassatus TaxID=53992 RepID=A0AA36H7N3_CYLNA|nr:unnamed protein product [Cylicocyclus nassatus]